MLKLSAASQAEQEGLGAALAKLVPHPCVIYLEGELGSGKTTLVRGFLQGLGHQGAVKSPTYTLIEPYRLQGRDYFHLDLYRLGHPEELEYLGLRDMLREDSVLLVEWPERGAGVLPGGDLRIVIRYDGAGRSLQLVPHSPTGEQLIGRFNHELQQLVKL